MMGETVALGVSRQGVHKKERIAEIDFLRGFAVFLMIFDHLTYDFTYWDDVILMIGGRGTMAAIEAITPWVQLGMYVQGSDWRFYLHCIFVGVFFLISGISATFSKKHWERTTWLILIGYGLSAVMSVVASYAHDSNLMMFMGLLNAMAIAHFVYAIKNIFFKDKWSDLYFCGIFLVLTIAFTAASPVRPNAYSVARYSSYSEYLSTEWYGNYWGFVSGQMHGGLDYIRPLPCTAILFLGSFVGKTLYKKRKAYVPQLRYAQPFIFMGQHSFLVYVLHQFVLVAILAIATLATGFIPDL